MSGAASRAASIALAIVETEGAVAYFVDASSVSEAPTAQPLIRMVGEGHPHTRAGRPSAGSIHSVHRCETRASISAQDRLARAAATFGQPASYTRSIRITLASW